MDTKKVTRNACPFLGTSVLGLIAVLSLVGDFPLCFVDVSRLARCLARSDLKLGRLLVVIIYAEVIKHASLVRFLNPIRYSALFTYFIGFPVLVWISKFAFDSGLAVVVLAPRRCNRFDERRKRQASFFQLLTCFFCNVFKSGSFLLLLIFEETVSF